MSNEVTKDVSSPLVIRFTLDCPDTSNVYAQRNVPVLHNFLEGGSTFGGLKHAVNDAMYHIRPQLLKVGKGIDDTGRLHGEGGWREP
jgi:hypothetical protein